MQTSHEGPEPVVLRGYTLRRMQVERPGELDLVVSRSLKTILESIPELKGSEVKARQLVPNFGHEEMKTMYLRDQQRPATHRFVVAQAETGEIGGHAVHFLRESEDGLLVGYLFTLYVDPAHRRRGLGNALLVDAILWLESHGAVRIGAHTHMANLALLQLAVRCGFEIVEQKSQPWSHLVLERRAAKGLEPLPGPCTPGHS